MSYGPRGNPGVNELGLVVRVQEVASGVVTRPVMVGRTWADRCTDDWEGAIPECEWVGRLWPHPGGTASWPPPGHKTHWAGWQPPSTAASGIVRPGEGWWVFGFGSVLPAALSEADARLSP
jgi:hypothetical protein